MKWPILTLALFGCDASISRPSAADLGPSPTGIGEPSAPSSTLPGAPSTSPSSPTMPGVPSTSAPMTPPQASACAPGRDYTGFAGESLRSDRPMAAAGREMRRPKAYAALVTEYPRVLGNTPALLSGAETTFGAPPARWFSEATTSGVTVYTAYRIAFQGCLALTAQPATYNAAPAEPAARAECATWAERFWSRRALAPTVASKSSCKIR
jgi:hypothetical protein